ncbi:hypothetical protein [Kitasatospora purpeofusca]|uniref:hypothetical protein n=1 Tax=Kitasatospora purpeofusca TaxID=67352 RepID=UPI0035D8178A
MNLDQWTSLRETPAPIAGVSAAEIGGPDRTVLFGFTCERLSWHVYLADGQIHLATYDSQTAQVTVHQRREYWPAAELIPDKRVYPESTDWRFAQLMVARAIAVPYRNWDESRARLWAPLAFHGLIVSPEEGRLVQRTDPAPAAGNEAAQ